MKSEDNVISDDHNNLKQGDTGHSGDEL